MKNETLKKEFVTFENRSGIQAQKNTASECFLLVMLYQSDSSIWHPYPTDLEETFCQFEREQNIPGYSI